ncbi:hypothetical protein HRbin36_02342 [bacterium HR36]|nr:hypothetical protein HRbin36_02342 [bacterium HR36]
MRKGAILSWLTIAIIFSVGVVLADSQKVTRLIVHLPADAQLFINGHRTQQTGSIREFVTPPLAEGKTYSYVLRAIWTGNGKLVSVEREVGFRAGEVVQVHFGQEQLVAGDLAVRQRQFLFTYAARVTGLKPGQLARIWLPVAVSNADQEVEIAKRDLPPNARVETHTEPKFGNRILYVEARANDQGEIPLSITYRVKRWEVRGDARSREDSEALTRLFLGPDSRVPVGGKALRLIEGKPLPSDQLALAKLLYDTVNQHMVYSKKGVGWGQGDAEWACDNGYGNCTDFHSLFMALARAQGIPVRFEIGFPLPEQRGQGEVPGYHCWAWFKPHGRGWIPVDISEANKVKNTRPEMVEYYFGNLTEDRVTFSVGRDIDLVPKQAGPPLNFFIYPYVEVAGRALDPSQIHRQFTYHDLP